VVVAMAREAVKALIVANQFLETDFGETKGCGLDGLLAKQVVRASAAGPERLV
jgi:hypothetical protein